MVAAAEDNSQRGHHSHDEDSHADHYHGHSSKFSFTPSRAFFRFSSVLSTQKSLRLVCLLSLHRSFSAARWESGQFIATALLLLHGPVKTLDAYVNTFIWIQLLVSLDLSSFQSQCWTSHQLGFYWRWNWSLFYWVLLLPLLRFSSKVANRPTVTTPTSTTSTSATRYLRVSTARRLTGDRPSQSPRSPCTSRSSPPGSGTGD